MKINCKPTLTEIDQRHHVEDTDNAVFDTEDEINRK